MILLFKYHNNKTVAAITQADIELYIVYIKTVHKVGRAKCRSVASACAYFYKQVIKILSCSHCSFFNPPAIRVPPRRDHCNPTYYTIYGNNSQLLKS
jgi:hypothetical protein